VTSVAVLGSTGSIGTQTLEVIAAEPDRFTVTAIGAHSSVDDLVAQAHAVGPQVVAIADGARAAELRERLPDNIAVEAGPGAFAALAGSADVVVNGVVGFAGLPVTLGALNAGRRLALANKESLIAAGPVVERARRTPGAELVPVDSEHCAVHQCLRAGEGTKRLEEIVLTASGGPFRGRSDADLRNVTVDEALAHPTWSMGPKITVDSSTLVNKGLEVIEAHELFGVDYDHIDVVVHPQSIVHSLVEFVDGSVIAQLSPPDMRLPIQYALSYPRRLPGPARRLDVAMPLTLDFEPPDPARFPALRLGLEAAERGGTAGAVLNAANEEAVQGFLDGRLRFTDIAEVCAGVLAAHPYRSDPELDELRALDAWARQEVASWASV